MPSTSAMINAIFTEQNKQIHTYKPLSINDFKAIPDTTHLRMPAATQSVIGRRNPKQDQGSTSTVLPVARIKKMRLIGGGEFIPKLLLRF